MRKKKMILAVISVVLMLISMVGASVVQTSGGKVSVEEVKFDTAFGSKMSAVIYKPKGADEANPAPGIVLVHGMYNNKEMQDANLVELSRRGYVVMAIDMFSHGDSDILDAADNLPMSGMAGLQYFLTLPYVDKERIGMSGHSMGGLNCDLATQMCRNEDGSAVVKALFLNCCFATYAGGDGAYADVYGETSVAILADQYDEFLFQEVNSDGTALLPRDFIKSDNAQSFLNFGAALEDCEARESNTIYRQVNEGKEALRVVYTPAYNHPWSHFSKTGTAFTLEFFDEVLGNPVSIAPYNQVWQFKEFFNFVGLIGMAIFAVAVTLNLIDVGPFKELKVQEEVPARQVSQKRGSTTKAVAVISAVLSAILYIPIVTGIKGDTTARVVFSQASTFALGTWVAVSGLILVIGMIVIQSVNKGDGLTLDEMGVKIGGRQLGLTILVAAVASFLTFVWVILADLLFKTDFRIWFMAAKTMTWKLFFIALFPNLLFFLVYYVANSILVNGFSYYSQEKGKAANTAFQAVISVFPALILVVLQYVKLFTTGSVMFSTYNGSSAHSMILWLFPMLLIIPAAVVISRAIYKETKNPYLPAIINAVLVTLITCANTSSWG